MKNTEKPINRFNLWDKVIVLSELESTVDGSEIVIPITRIVVGMHIGANDVIEYTLDGGVTAVESVLLHANKARDAFSVLADDYRLSYK